MKKNLVRSFLIFQFIFVLSACSSLDGLRFWNTDEVDPDEPRELEAFSKFGSDLDAATLNVIEKGRRNVEILKQNQNDPFQVEDQVAIIYAGSQNLLKEVPVEKVKAFEEAFLQELRKNNKKLLAELKSGKISDKETDEIKKVAEKVAKSF